MAGAAHRVLRSLLRCRINRGRAVRAPTTDTAAAAGWPAAAAPGPLHPRRGGAGRGRPERGQAEGGHGVAE